MPAGTTAPRVLVVDDEQSVRTFADRVLRDGGYDVTTASDAPEALSSIDPDRPFDLFVIDLMMPQMRGDELAVLIRRSYPDAKVLYFTGYSDQLFREKAVLWANEAFVEKPVTTDGLLQAASLMLYGHIRGPAAR